MSLGPDNPSRRVLVTGIGLVTACGSGRETSWAAIRQGFCRIWPLEAGDGPPHHGFPAPYPNRFAEFCDPTALIVRDCLLEATADADLRQPGGALTVDPVRLAVLVGLSKGRMLSLEDQHARCLKTGDWEHQQDERLTSTWPHHGSTLIARMLDAQGPCLAPVAACATGLVAAIQGADLIRRGDCDVAVVGAIDASISPFLLGAFRSMRALARINEGDDPSRASRPCDRNRSGFLVGEGGALLVLESQESAQARGVDAYAEFAGGALGSDAHHITNLNPDPACLAHVITRALRRSRLSPDQIDHINLHGTATRSNDPLECRAIHRALGPAATRVACSASKPQIGHLLGAAGAVELALTCLAIRDGFVPPTLNLDDPDPDCNLDATPLIGQSRDIQAALKLSLGFGGHLAAAVLSQPATAERRPARALPLDATPGRSSDDPTTHPHTGGAGPSASGR